MDYPQYDPASAVTPLTATELDGLDRLLQLSLIHISEPTRPY